MLAAPRPGLAAHPASAQDADTGGPGDAIPDGRGGDPEESMDPRVPRASMQPSPAEREQDF